MPCPRERRIVHRRYAPKTRTGCATCKIRRVKCDEAKPFCNRCTSTGRKCDGYASPECDATSSESISVALTVDVPCDALEKRTFDFFRCRTAPCVSGYFQDSVWDRYVLQVSHSEPAIRHAVNALASLHEQRTLREKSNKSGTEVSHVGTNFHVKQYSMALRGLQDLLSRDNPSMNLVLMCSLLFIHFESLRESYIPALVHTENAIRLLQSSTTFDSKKIEPSLVRALMRIDVQGAMYIGLRVPGLPFYTATVDSTLPSTFQDLTHARDTINTWTCRMYHFIRQEADDYKLREVGDVPLETYAKAQDLEQKFLDLDKLLWDFMHKPSARLALREQHGLAMLRAKVKINRILCATALYAEATLFDSYLDQFQEINTICDFVLSSERNDRRLLSVSLDEGMLHPLHFVSVHCRDGRIRRHALDQLTKLPREGETLWHVEALTRAAHLCVDFEEAFTKKESPTCEDIPEWHRIHSAGYDLWENSSPAHTLKALLRVRPNGTDGEWTDAKEIIQWSTCSNSASTPHQEHIADFRSNKLVDDATWTMSEAPWNTYAPVLGFKLKTPYNEWQKIGQLSEV